MLFIKSIVKTAMHPVGQNG